MKVALVHDWLVTYGGAERVLEQMLECFPAADLYSLVDVLPHGERHFLRGRHVHVSPLQRLPFVRTRYRSYLPVMPLAVEQFDLAGYDLVLSSSHAIAKGVLTGPNQLHLSYCHSPMRYAWDMQHQYLRESKLDRGMRGVAARYLLHRLRRWDARTAAGVDQFAANSQYIARRIRKAYGRESVVIYPPVDVDGFATAGGKDDFYVTASRLVPYKRVDLVVQAFAGMRGRRLVVIGGGPEEARIRAAAPPNVTVLGQQPIDVLRDHLQRARAFVFAAEEDFGIAPVEAQACGTPVIAFGRGGACETVRGLDAPAPTGLLFAEQSAAAIRDAVAEFERSESRITRHACRTNALRFAPERFREELLAFVRAASGEGTARERGRPASARVHAPIRAGLRP